MTGMAQIASYFHYTAILCNDINYMVLVLFRIFDSSKNYQIL